MKTIPLFLMMCLTVFSVNGQIIYEEFTSDKLEETRKLKIQLPRNYEENTNKVYPVVLVLDADYLFEPVAGNVDYFSYWEDMPESIVIGIMQGDKRYDDCSYDDDDFLPAEKGAQFFEFIGLELMPYIDNNYRTAKFVIGVGHDYTANFLNYYLYKDPPLMNGFIAFSPDLAPNTASRLAGRLPAVKNKTFYYLATGSDDIKDLKNGSIELDAALKAVKNDNFEYYFDNFEGATHYSLVGRGIPNALEKIFSVYRPISKQEFKDVVMKLETPISQYLIDKYKTIEDLFGLTNPIRVNDFIATATASDKRKQWESLETIAQMAIKAYPETVLGPYYLGLFYQKTDQPKKAMRTYQAAFDKEEVDFITVDMLLDKADDIKEEFGY